MPLLNAPLILAICQARFSPIRKMGKFVDDMQEELRKCGFPQFKTHETIGVKFSIGNQGKPTPSGPFNETTWEFIAGDRKSSILITTESISLLYTKEAYGSTAEYLNRFENAVKIMNEIASPSLMNRLGIRIIDLVTDSADGVPQEVFADGLYNQPFGALGGHESRNVFQTQLEFPNNLRSVITVNRGLHGRILPENVGLFSLEMDSEQVMAEPHCILDTDTSCTYPAGLSFDAGRIRRDAEMLYEKQREIFKSAIKEDVMQKWREE